MKLSIILPVYNVENFIADCFDSLLNQDLDKSEYEIICVDDGSPDNSYKVIEEYQSRNENIRLIRQQNGGVSTARNNGLKEANGKYVWYIDPDDYILPNCLKKIISAMEEHDADVCTFNYKEVAENSSSKDIEEKDFKFTIATDYSSTGSCCFHVVRRDYLLKHEIILNKELGYGEDYLWSFQINYRVHVGIKTEETLYFYRQRLGSAMHGKTKEKQVKHMNDMISLAKVYDIEFERCKEENLPKKVLKNVKRRKMLCVQSVVFDLVKIANGKKEIKDKLGELKTQGLYPYRIQWWYLGAKELNPKFINRLVFLLLPCKSYVILLNKLLNRKG